MSKKYLEEVVEDIENYIPDYYTEEEYNQYAEDGELASMIKDDMWAEDGVTGNYSGSYTFDIEARDNILNDKFETIVKAIEEGMYDAESLGKAIVDDDWETLDVVCRCYVLYEAADIVARKHPKYDF